MITSPSFFVLLYKIILPISVQRAFENQKPPAMKRESLNISGEKSFVWTPKLSKNAVIVLESISNVENKNNPCMKVEIELKNNAT